MGAQRDLLGTAERVWDGKNVKSVAMCGDLPT